MGEFIGWVWLHQAQHGGWMAQGASALFLTVAVLMGESVLIALLVRALEHAGVSEKAACVDMGVDAAQWSRQKRGEARNHASLQRADRLPPLVLQWWAVLLAEHFGLPQEVQQAMRLYRGLAGRRVMAKMNLPQQQTKAGVA